MGTRVRRAVLAVAAVLTLAACASKSTTSPTTVTVPVTTVAPAAAGSNSNAAIDQQIQNLNSSVSQVSGDLASADKAIANGG
jgi:ABC-type glycerol-3-phosphate transport system substrate-binding protein